MNMMQEFSNIGFCFGLNIRKQLSYHLRSILPMYLQKMLIIGKQIPIGDYNKIADFRNNLSNKYYNFVN